MNSDLRFLARKLLRNKTINAIKIAGLAIGFSSFLTVILFAGYEFDFESFNADRDRTFRIYVSHVEDSGRVVKTAPIPIKSIIENTFSGIEAITHFYILRASVVIPENQNHRIDDLDRMILCTSQYFDVFNYYQWVLGNASELNLPGNVVLTESKARFYFGDIPLDSTIGKVIIYKDSILTKVSGIVKDPEGRTDLDFTEFISFNTIPDGKLASMLGIYPDNWSSIHTRNQFFIKLTDNEQVKLVYSQFSKLSDYYKKNYLGEWAYKPNLQRLVDLHFNQSLGVFENSKSVTDKTKVKALTLIGIILLVIACVNYINIEISLSNERIKEFGTRSVLGISKMQALKLSLLDTLIGIILSTILAIPITILITHYFQDLLPPNLNDYVYSLNTFGCIIIFIIFLVIGVGIYPSVLMLRSISSTSTSLDSHTWTGKVVAKSIVVFQFSFAQFLLFGAVFVILQLKYLLTKDLGFNVENIICVTVPFQTDSRDKEKFLRGVLQEASVSAASYSSPPAGVGVGVRKETAKVEAESGKEVKSLFAIRKNADTNLLDIFNIELLAGRNLSKNDSITECLINETAFKQLGYASIDNILNRKIDNKLVIVGVVKDFHTSSMHNSIEPVVIENKSSNWLNIRLTSSDLKSIKVSVERIKALWEQTFDEPFNPIFLNDSIKRYYESEIKTQKIVSMAASLTFFVSMIGLYGLFLITLGKRKKEIGIRMAFGAMSSDILQLLFWNLFWTVAISFLLATPLAYHYVEIWLQTFSYRINNGPIPYIMVFFTLILLSIAIIFLITLRSLDMWKGKFFRHE